MEVHKQIKGKADKYSAKHGGDAHHSGQNAKQQNTSDPVQGFSQAPKGLQ